MTQREIDKRTGLKGRTRQFTFPVSESKFSGDRIMFNDTGSVRLDYSLDNKNGIPTVDTDLIHLSSGNERYYQQLEHFVFSDRTDSTTKYNEFTPTIADNYRIRNGHYEYLLMVSNNCQMLTKLNQHQQIFLLIQHKQSLGFTN